MEKSQASIELDQIFSTAELFWTHQLVYNKHNTDKISLF